MSFPRDQAAFQPLINSSAPAFNSSALGSTTFNYKLDSSGIRDWQGPDSRSVRLLSAVNTPYYVNFGASAVIAETTNSVLCLGGTPAIFSVSPSQTYVAMVSSTTVTVNVALGIGR